MRISLVSGSAHSVLGAMAGPLSQTGCHDELV